MKIELSPLKNEGISLPYAVFDFLKCYFYHGCNIDQYVRGGFYKLKGCERQSYLTYGRICKIYDWSIVQKYVPYLEHKATFNKHFAKFIHRKWLYTKEMTYDEFVTFCSSVSAYIVKPIGGHQGEGIYKITPPHFSQILTNGDDNLQHDMKLMFDKFSSTDCILEECVYSHERMRFGGQSLNTIRIHTFMDKNGVPHIEKSLLRVGVGDSVVDNYCAGGCVYEVDQNNGMIISTALSRQHSEAYIHPLTNTVMIGRQLPFWEDVCKLAISAHLLLPQIKYIGWDIAITDNGVDLIEGNHHADYELFEFVGRRKWWSILKKYIQ
jgi:hypothetical protein